MSFSLRRAGTWAMVLVVFLSGCGLNTGESAPKRNPPSYSGQGFSCVGRIPEHFDKYVNNQLAVEEITTFISCLQKAFTTFAQLTRGRDATTYEPDEIRRFLHEFFLGKRRVSDALMTELMILKQTIVGGSVDRITRRELHLAVEILEELRVEAIKLKPHLQVLNPRLAKLENPAQLGSRLVEANNALSSSIQVIAARLQRSQRDYPLANLQNLLGELRVFVGWEEHFQQAIPVEKWVNFVRVFRNLTVIPDGSAVVRSGDWAPLLQSLSRWYLVYLQYEVGVKNQPVLRDVGLQNMFQLGQEIFHLLEASISRQEGLTISFSQLDELVQALHDLHWIPSRVRPNAANRALRALITRMLGDASVPASERSTSGLSLVGLTRARDFFYRWAYVQMNLAGEDREPMGPNRPVVPIIQVRPYLHTEMRAQLKELSSSEWDDFLKVRDLMRPLFPEGSYRTYLVGNSDLVRYGLRHNFHNLSLMNLFRTATGLIFRGYAEQASSQISWSAGITSKELQKFYEDFRDIGIDLKLVDERNLNTGARAFIEGNLFTYSADGLYLDENLPQARMRFVEMMELFAFLFSGGQMAYDMYAHMHALCEKGPTDINGRDKVSRECVLRELPAMLDVFLVNMPDLHAYLVGGTPERRQAYARTLLETAFSPHHSVPDWVELNELSTLAVVIHYSEAVMTRYDANHDGRLQNPEIDLAANVFTGFIKKFAKEKMNQNLNDGTARAAFYYILQNREMPTGFRDIGWTWIFGPQELSLDRGDLSNVFKVIIAKLFDTGKTRAPSPSLPPAQCQGMDIVLTENCVFGK